MLHSLQMKTAESSELAISWRDQNVYVISTVCVALCRRTLDCSVLSSIHTSGYQSTPKKSLSCTRAKSDMKYRHTSTQLPTSLIATCCKVGVLSALV